MCIRDRLDDNIGGELIPNRLNHALQINASLVDLVDKDNGGKMCIRDRPPALLDGHALPQQKGRKLVKAASLGKCLPYRPAPLRLVRFLSLIHI